MNIPWESILPKKAQVEEDQQGYEEIQGYNQAIEDCFHALKLAESEGKICVPLSVEVIAKIIDDEADKFKTSEQIGELIHAAMTRRDE